MRYYETDSERVDPEWYTADMVAAERELDARIDHAMSLVRETDARLAELERQDADNKLSDEDVNRLQAYVSGHARTEEWQKVIDKVAEGRLTWRQIAEDVVGRTDPDVAAAFRSLERVPPATEDTLVALGFQPAQPPAAEPAYQHADDPDDEDWLGFSDGSSRIRR